MKQKYLKVVGLVVSIAFTASAALAQDSTNARLEEFKVALQTVNDRLALMAESSVEEAEYLCPGFMVELQAEYSDVQASKDISCGVSYGHTNHVRLD